LASNQVEYSLVARAPERNGLLDVCRELGVVLIAYSPLGQGLLTGKYSPERPPSGIRRRALSRKLAAVQPLVGLLTEIGQGHGGKTPAQVAINWAISKGTLSIPGARDAYQATQNAGAAGWRLSVDEMDALDAASAAVTQ
ncbi:MAG: aldo/keto reductase, partial [Anaerolineae bacterium]|nr:aldo/keto reductase [Anaerolineae bacterium]